MGACAHAGIGAGAHAGRTGAHTGTARAHTGIAGAHTGIGTGAHTGAGTCIPAGAGTCIVTGDLPLGRLLERYCITACFNMIIQPVPFLCHVGIFIPL